MQEGAAFIVLDILADRAARSVAFGLGLDSAVGTSKDLRDNIVFTPRGRR